MLKCVNLQNRWKFPSEARLNKTRATAIWSKTLCLLMIRARKSFIYKIVISRQLKRCSLSISSPLFFSTLISNIAIISGTVNSICCRIFLVSYQAIVWLFDVVDFWVYLLVFGEVLFLRVINVLRTWDFLEKSFYRKITGRIANEFRWEIIIENIDCSQYNFSSLKPSWHIQLHLQINYRSRPKCLMVKLIFQ